MLKISGAMIVRDAAATVRAAIESLRPTCDEVVVLDTGSTDGTLEILRDLARAWAEDAGGTKLDVWEWAWRDDFSAARNEVQSHCSGEWIVVLDADEVLTAGDLRERLLTAEERIDAAVALLVAQGDGGAVDRYWQMRAYRRSRCRWIHPVHNQLRGARTAVRTTAKIRTSYAGDLQRRLDRSVPMLLRFCETNPTDIHGPLMLAFTYAAVASWREALRWAERGIALKSPSPDESRCWLIRAQAMLNLHGIDAGERAIAEGVAAWPDAPDLRYQAISVAVVRWGLVAARAETDGRFALTSLRPLPRTPEEMTRMQSAFDQLDLRVDLVETIRR